MKIKDRIIVNLEDMKQNGFIIWHGRLIAPCQIYGKEALELYEIKKPLTEKEIADLRRNFRKGMKKIEGKLRGSGPIIIRANNIYLADALLIKTRGERNPIIGEVDE